MLPNAYFRYFIEMDCYCISRAHRRVLPLKRVGTTLSISTQSYLIADLETTVCPPTAIFTVLPLSLRRVHRYILWVLCFNSYSQKSSSMPILSSYGKHKHCIIYDILQQGTQYCGPPTVEVRQVIAAFDGG